MKEEKEKNFIVGIGFSAGGLKPLQKFFDCTPNDDATYIILNHLQPDYKSLLGSILRRHSKLEIHQAEDGVLISRDKIYMLPSNKYMTIKGDHLHLQPRNILPMYPNVAIDVFLKSLAEEKRNKSIAVILSGNGSDGTKGAKLIKEMGGMVIVQKPQSSDYSSMPENVIKNNAADHQLLPEEMPETILQHISKCLNGNSEL